MCLTTIHGQGLALGGLKGQAEQELEPLLTPEVPWAASGCQVPCTGLELSVGCLCLGLTEQGPQGWAVC
jgi:hypothetical protein